MHARSFGMVAVPLRLRGYLVVGTALVVVASFAWERALRRLFPASQPPAKGYLVHARQLAALRAQGAAGKKEQ
jgi:hypothetical protein